METIQIRNIVYWMSKNLISSGKEVALYRLEHLKSEDIYHKIHIYSDEEKIVILNLIKNEIEMYFSMPIGRRRLNSPKRYL